MREKESARNDFEGRLLVAEAFDPYLKWLGIRKTRSRVTHYRLLGLELFESDVDVIASAAERQIRHVETFETPELRDTCKQIISEIRAARDCLLNQQTREKYDQKLRQLRKERKKDRSKKEKRWRATDGTRSVEEKKGKPVIGVDPIDSGPAASPTFDFGDNVDVVGKSKAALGPSIKTADQKRRRKRPGFDWAGWILGAVGAAAFAWVLVNTDIIDRIKGRTPDNDVAMDVASDAVEPKTEKLTTEPAKAESSVSTDNRSAKHSDADDERKQTKNNSPDREALPRVPKSGRLNDKKREKREPDLPTSNRSASKPTSTSRPRPAAAQPLAVPEAEALKQALATVRSRHVPELKGNDMVAKKILARTLYLNASKQEDPAIKYAVLQISTELAREIGALDSLVNANQQMARYFKVEFWDRMSESAQKTIGSAAGVEAIAIELDDLLERAYSDKQFMLGNQLANEAAKLARRDGDRLQQEMLVDFAKEMKSLEALSRRGDAVKLKLAKRADDKDVLSAKDKMTLGQHLCFGSGDWKAGLGYLGEGVDRTLASVAKTDLNAIDDEKSNFEVADAWFKLSQKNKYNGYLRRGMLRRAQEKLERSTRSESGKMLDMIRMNLQPVKLYVTPTGSTLNKTYTFDVQGPTSFDSARLERGSMLRLGLGNKSRLLIARQANGGYEAVTRDGALRFLVRWLENGIAEMRIYDTASNQLQNILYGKEE